jgi:hypothetical protein
VGIGTTRSSGRIKKYNNPYMNQELKNAIQIIAKHLEENELYYKAWQRNIVTCQIAALNPFGITPTEIDQKHAFIGAGMFLDNIIIAAEAENGWTYNPESNG